MPMTDEMPAATALEAISGRLRTIQGLDPIADALRDLAAVFREAFVENVRAEERELTLYRAAGGRLH